MKISLALAVPLVSTAAFASSPEAVPDGGRVPVAVRLFLADGKPAKDVDLLKGRAVDLSARLVDAAGRDVPNVPIVWSAGPDGSVNLAIADRRATVTALRDALDAPDRRTPKATVKACAASACASIVVSCLVDVAGAWSAKLDFDGIPHAEDRKLVFVQTGRVIKFEAEPGRVATLVLDDMRVRMVDGGGVLTRFDGVLTDRKASNGRWASSWGFKGKWNATRDP